MADVKRRNELAQQHEKQERFPATEPPRQYEDAPIPAGTAGRGRHSSSLGSHAAWFLPRGSLDRDGLERPAGRPGERRRGPFHRAGGIPPRPMRSLLSRACQAATATLEQKEDASFRKYAFNALRSNQLPLRRPLLDSRSPSCKGSMYPATLPRASVIICFAEEMWSSLFRTVWSVLDRTPAHLLEEIILVNDASTASWLQEDLDEYMRHMPPVVRVVKSPTRLGAARAMACGGHGRC